MEHQCYINLYHLIAHMMPNVYSHEVGEEKADNRECTDADHVDHLKLLIVLLVVHPARAAQGSWLEVRGGG